MATAVERAILRAAAEYGLIEKGDRIAAAVSGGADSVALCHALFAAAGQLGIELTVCHYNHRLRGAESVRDERFVRELAQELGLEFRCGGGDVAGYAAERGLTVEEAGRELRYAFLRQCAGEGGKIATAHNKNDNAETLLLNIARGSGTRGLAGIPRRRGNIIRPLLDCSRAEIERYIEARGLRYVTDSSNLEDRYARNRMRHIVLPELERLSPAFLENAARLAERAARDSELLEELARKERERLSTGSGLPVKGLLALPRPLSDRILLGLLRESGAEISSRAVELMRGLAEQGAGALELRGGTFFQVSGGFASVGTRPELQPYFEKKIALPNQEKSIEIDYADGKRLKITLIYNKDGKITQKLHKQVLKNALCCDKIKGVVLRQRLTGDALRLKHRRVTKTIKKLCNEEGMPEPERARLAVLCDGDNVMWCERFGADEKYLAGAESRKIIIIEALGE